MAVSVGYSPTPGAAITPSTPIIVTLTGALTGLSVLVVYPDGSVESPIASQSPYVFSTNFSGSTINTVGPVTTLTLVRGAGGWPLSPMVTGSCLDSGHNTTAFNAAWLIPGALIQSYASLQDFYDLGVPIKATGQVVSPTTINKALVSATATINSFLQSQFVLPLHSWDFSLNQANVDLSQYLVLAHRGVASDDPSGILITQRRDKTMKWLLSVSLREAHPVCVDSSPQNKRLTPAYAPFCSPWLGFGG